MAGVAHRQTSVAAAPAKGRLRTLGASLAAAFSMARKLRRAAQVCALVLCCTPAAAQTTPSANFPFPDDPPLGEPTYAPPPGYAPNNGYAANPGYAPNNGYAPNPSYGADAGYAAAPAHPANAGYGGYAPPTGFAAGSAGRGEVYQVAGRQPPPPRPYSGNPEELPPPPIWQGGPPIGPGFPPPGYPQAGPPPTAHSTYGAPPGHYVAPGWTPPPAYYGPDYPPPNYIDVDGHGDFAPTGRGMFPRLPGEFMDGCAECQGDGSDDIWNEGPDCGPNQPCTPKKKFADLGLGAEALPFATFELDTARPSNYYRLRLDSVKRWLQPDKIEYLMARQGGLGKGQANIDSFVNFVDVRMAFEAGGDKIGVLTEIPIRALDSEFNSNNVGLGDMTVAPKIMIMDEGHFQLTQITRIIILTGYFHRGLGTGHMSMEPGFLANYKLSCTTYLHGEFKYWFPIGADFTYTGTMFRYGFGISHLLYERPHQDFAIIPVLEFVGFTILDGAASDPTTGGYVDVGPQTIVNCMPGVRVMLAEGTEVGLQAGFHLTTTQFYSGMLRAEVRINY